MSRRLNLYGFSAARMRGLCGSGDAAALADLAARIPAAFPAGLPAWRDQLAGVLGRAVTAGVPFPDLDAETDVHAAAAGLLASHGQEWLVTGASRFHASALDDGLWGRHRRHAAPEARAFLRALVEGVPLFGRAPAGGAGYAAVGADALRAFLPHLRDLAEVVAHRVARRRSATDEDRAGAEFAAVLCGWVGEVADAGLDLWSAPG